MIISSPANERLKLARRVRDGREAGLLFIEGERLSEECLQANLPLIACFHSPEPSARTQTILATLEQRQCPLWPTTDAVLATISDTVQPQGLILLAERPRTTLAQALAGRNEQPPLTVCCDAIQDPGNLGTILRTAEAAGASGLITLKGTTDVFAPKTLRSAMGSAFRLPLATGLSTDELLFATRAAGLRLVAADGAAKHTYLQYDWRRPTAVVLGNEARGLRTELLERCDAHIRIPLHAPVESLNVASAAAVILFEAARQRQRT